MGVEYAFLPDWSAKIEYNDIDYGTRGFAGTPWLRFQECKYPFRSQRMSASSKLGELSVLVSQPAWTVTDYEALSP
jgi:hypothetical protein